MKTGKRRTFYWDANVFIAWLKGETCWPPSVIAGMNDVAREVTENRAILFTSTLTSTEILQGTLTSAQRTKLAELLQRSNVNQIAADSRITDRASAIREYYNTRGNKIKTPDAIHLATAILYKADEMQTMDGLAAKSNKKTELLALSGNVAGHNLLIVNPYPLHSPPQIAVTVTGPLFPEAITIQALAPNEQTDGSAKTQEGSHERKTDSAHPPSVRGSNEGRAHGEAAGEIALRTQAAKNRKKEG
jgi:predicted nucleic acid-binding protein